MIKKEYNIIFLILIKFTNRFCMSSKIKSLNNMSKKNRALLTDPMDDNNPITVQVLGICSALAITVQVKASIVMSFLLLQ